MLLAAFLFARSSERLHTYLIEHPHLGAYIRNYEQHTMTRAHKVRTLALMWTGILVSAALINKPITWVILPLIACGVTVHIWRLRGSQD